MGFVSKRGKIVCRAGTMPWFRTAKWLSEKTLTGKKAEVTNEFYYILFQLIFIVIILAALIQYVNHIATDLGFEKRFASIDMALTTTAVYYAPGTLKQTYRPIVFESPIDAEFSDSVIAITERGTQLPPVFYWYLRDTDMYDFREEIPIRALFSQSNEEGFEIPEITYYRTGLKISFDGQRTNALQLECPGINTTEPNWEAKKIFIAKILSSTQDYQNTELPTNRIAQILSARHGQITTNDQETITNNQETQRGEQVGQISAIPSDADMIIAIGETGEERETGSLVVYVPADENLLRERKLGCFLINELLTDETTAHYVQVMTVYPEMLESDSPLRIFKERARQDQLIVFLDISNFDDDKIDEENAAEAISNAVIRYYGGGDIEPVTGATLTYIEPEYFGVSETGQAPPGLTGRGDTPAQRMFSVCTSEEINLEQGIENLKAITAYWVRESQNDGAVYVNSGTTSQSGECTSGSAGREYLLNFFSKHFPADPLPASCAGNTGTETCLREMRDEYNRKAVSQLSGRYLCGDCMTYLRQLFQCAFGRLQNGETHPWDAPVIASTPGAITGTDANGIAVFDRHTGADGRDVFGTPHGTCWQEVIQPQLNGQLQFGDIIQLPGHYLMYSGGAGLEYEIIEMGGWGFGGEVELRKSTISKRFPGNEELAGVRTVMNAEQALNSPRVNTGCIIRRASRE
jgi:hypothetical protein